VVEAIKSTKKIVSTHIDYALRESNIELDGIHLMDWRCLVEGK